MKRDGGLDILEGEDKEAAENLCEKLAEYGLFVVKKGELESWLPSLGASGHGPSWLIDVFQKMGEDPEDQSYLRPGVDDVWSCRGDSAVALGPEPKGHPVVRTSMLTLSGHGRPAGPARPSSPGGADHC